MRAFYAYFVSVVLCLFLAGCGGDDSNKQPSGALPSPPRSAPEISTQPASQTVTAGQNVSFSVTAMGFIGMTYQWHRDGTSISGATSSTYQFTATLADNGANRLGNGVLAIIEAEFHEAVK